MWRKGRTTSSGATYDRFVCFAADPKGGFYVVVDGAVSDVYYVAEDATAARGVTKLTVSPSLADVKAMAMATDNRMLRTCALRAVPGGTLYLQTSRVLLKLAIAP